MGGFTCFPSISWKSSSSKKQQAISLNLDNKEKLKVINTKVYPGDALEADESRSSLASSLQSSFTPSENKTPSKTGLTSPSSSSSLVDDCQRGEVLPAKQPELTSSLSEAQGVNVANQEDSNLKYVAEWVSNLQELSCFEEEEQQNETPKQNDIINNNNIINYNNSPNPERELNKIVVQSLSPAAHAANISGFGLRTIPPLGTFNNLRRLLLSGNCIAKITGECLPKSLHVLDLSRNQISTIEGLRGLTRLRVLNLSHNKISRIGHGLGDCTSIKELYLSGNKISEVEGLHRLRKLFLLDLSNNRLTTTKSLVQLAANYNCLQALNLLGNAVMHNVGEEQLRRSITAILPNLTYLNNQPIKPVPAREAVVGKFSRRELGNHHVRKVGNKAKRVQKLQDLSSTKSPRRRRNKHF